MLKTIIKPKTNVVDKDMLITFIDFKEGIAKQRETNTNLEEFGVEKYCKTGQTNSNKYQVTSEVYGRTFNSIQIKNWGWTRRLAILINI